jgi:putative DNA primase/helicase
MTNINIDQQHLAEFNASKIESIIAALNCRSWNPEDEHDLDEVFTSIIPAPEHNNNGTLAGTSAQQLAGILRSGGWIFEGYKGVCVKPNAPRQDKDGKTIKYESPRGVGNQQLFIPRVSVQAGIEIAIKFGSDFEQEYRQRIELLNFQAEDTGFWAWFEGTKIPIIITEGVKKALALISAGYPAIGLNGVWGWGTNIKDLFGGVEKDDRGKSLKTLHPDLEPFLDGRELVLAFDRDTNSATVRMVEAAKVALIQAIDDDPIEVTDLKWRTHKGIDDYIAAKGTKALDRIYSNRSEVKLPKPQKPQKSLINKFATTWDEGLQVLVCEESDRAKEIYAPVGSHLEAIAYVKGVGGGGAGILVEFRSQCQERLRLLIPRASLTGDGAEALRCLASQGYEYIRKQKELLLEYLFGLGREVERIYTIADKTGWVNGSFLTPAKTYGDPDLRFREPEPDHSLTEIKGTLDGWKSEVAAKCAGNSRLLFSLGTAFASPLLALAQIESGGFHLVGTTSIGKTTALNLAASVAGLKTIPNWRSTANALEGKAAEFNHLLLPLDEIYQADPQTVGASAYMLGNGQGKNRMNKTLSTVKPKTWELLFLSTGEVSMVDYLRQAKTPAKGGMEARMPSILADAGKGYGVFENLHGYKTSDEFVAALETAIRQHQGTAQDAYLTKLVEACKVEGFDKELRARVQAIAGKLSQQFKDTAISRVAIRFALVQVGLELAHSFNLLPLAIEQCGWAVKQMFDAWVNFRGGAGSIEIKEACNRIEHLFVSNQHNDDRIADAASPQGTRNLLAYRSNDLVTNGVEFWVPTPVFNKEFVDGVDKSALVKELQSRGWLKPSLDPEHLTRERRIAGKKHRVFVFNQFWINEKSPETPETPETGLEIGSNVELQPSPAVSDSKIDTGDTGDNLSSENNNEVDTVLPVSGVSGHENPPETDRRQVKTNDSKASSLVSPVSPVSPVKNHVSENSPEKNHQFKVGDRVRYTGNNANLLKQYAGIISIFEVSGDTYTCLKPDGKLTSWIELGDLQLMEIAA